MNTYEYSPEIETTIEDRKILERLWSRKKIRDLSYSREKCRFKATQFCGSIMLSNGIVEIVPRVQNGPLFYKSLYYMLGQIYSSAIPAPKAEPTTESLITEVNGLIDVVALLLCERMSILEKEGLYREFVEFHEIERFLIGRLLLSEQLLDASLKPQFHCEHDELTENNLHNQVASFTLRKLLSVVRSSEIRKRVIRSLTSFSPVDEANIDSTVLEGLSYSRLNQHYQPIHNLCRLILQNLSAENILGSRRATSFLVDINRVFESFIASVLESSLVGSSYFVKYQFPSHLFEPVNHQYRIPIKADIIVRSLRTNRISMVIDAKFRDAFVKNAKDGTAVRNSDFYQISSYASKFECFGLLVYASSSDINEGGIFLEWRAQDFELPSIGLAILNIKGSVEQAGLELASRVKNKLLID